MYRYLCIFITINNVIEVGVFDNEEKDYGHIYCYFDYWFGNT